MASYKASLEETNKLIDHLKNNGKDRSWAELTKLIIPNKKVGEDWSRSIARMKGFNTTTNQFEALQRVVFTKEKQANSQRLTQSNELIKRIIELEKDIELLSAVKMHTPARFDVPMPQANKKNEATAIVQFSDWHVDEVIEFQSTNGMNEFNKEIARKRAIKLSENTVKVLDSQRSAVDIHTVVLHLGGDSIGGYIHPELQQTNSMSPLQGIFYAKDLIVNSIEYLMAHGNIKNLVVVTSRGNHPRLTPKMQYANDYSMNLETFLYWSLQDYFKHDKRIAFKIEQSELAYITVYDKILRFFHGHQIRFQGGIGGLTVPLYKAIHRWNANIKAYYNFMCDKHTYSTPTPDCQVNGSLVGYNAYAVSHGFAYQPPLQSFTLLDSKRGITIRTPIFCE